MTRLGIVLLVGIVVSAVSFTSSANCLEPTKLKGAVTCVGTIKSLINELPSTFAQFIAPLLQAADALENASREFDSDPQDLQQVEAELVDASETIDGLNDPLFPFFENLVTDLKNGISALETDTPFLPLPDRIKNQILRTLDTLDGLSDRAQTSLTKLKDDLLRSGNGVLDAIDAALTALSLDEEDDARDALELAIKKLDVVINDTNRIVKKIVSALYKGVATLTKILKIAVNKVGKVNSTYSLSSVDKQAMIAQVFNLGGRINLHYASNGLYLTITGESGKRTIKKLIVLK